MIGRMREFLRLVTFAIALSFGFCAVAQPVAVIPQPARVEQHAGVLKLHAGMTMASDAACEPQARYLREVLFPSTGFCWKSAEKKSRADVVLEVDAARVPEAEGYRLTVDGKRERYLKTVNKSNLEYEGQKSDKTIVGTYQYGRTFLLGVRYKL